ncbi:MAG: mycothiol synthase [Actinomycetota bacterium]|nr:mycothiol synthase [Actinomycetota bacterium]
MRAVLDEAAVADVLALVEHAAVQDGARALNEQALLQIAADPGTSTNTGTQQRHVLARNGSAALVAYAYLDLADPRTGVTAEVVVDPEHRRAGWGSAVVSRALGEVGGAPMLLWSHGDHPGAGRMAKRLGFVKVRELWQLQRRLGADAPPLPEVRTPPGVTVRTFRVGVDEQAWLQLNAKVFADHPEQGATDAADLARRTGSAWFDPEGFFLAERNARLVGFHWTKVHTPARSASEIPPTGEVYVVGVDPDEQGSGLGSALTLIGLHHLAGRGLAAVLLYVEANNVPALRVYQRLGLSQVATDTQYRHPGG